MITLGDDWWSELIYGMSFPFNLTPDSHQGIELSFPSGIYIRVQRDLRDLYFSCVLHVGISCFIALCCIILHRHCVCFFFINVLKVCGNCALSKSIGAIFPTACAHIVSVSYFGNTYSILDIFIIVIFELLQSHDKILTDEELFFWMKKKVIS